MTGQKPIPAHRMILVTFHLNGRQIDVDWWAAQFNQATDWYRYAPGCWFIWTSGTAESWTKFLRQHLTADDYVVAVEITTFYGILPKGAWEWLRKYIALTVGTG